MQSLWKSTLIKATHHPLFYHNAQIDARGMAGSWLFWSQPSDLPLADKTSDKFDTFAIIKIITNDTHLNRFLKQHEGGVM